MKKLEAFLYKVFVTKAPAVLPPHAKELLVKYIPYLALLGALLTGLSALGLIMALIGSVQWDNNTALMVGNMLLMKVLLAVVLVVVAVECVLYAMAFGPLKAKRKKGWSLMVWVTLLGVVYSIATFVMDAQAFALLLSLVSSTLGLYILFQIRDGYSQAKPARQASTSKR